jgi:hypothetical protein
MKRILNIFFVSLGVIFFIIILIGVYFFVTDPLNLKPIVFGGDAILKSDGTNDAHSFISESQERALKTFGINPADIPSEITSEQETCFEDKLGEQRVNEIKAGDSPSVAEYLKARSCL